MSKNFCQRKLLYECVFIVCISFLTLHILILKLQDCVTFHFILHFMFDSLTKNLLHFRWISICFMIAKNVCLCYICILFHAYSLRMHFFWTQILPFFVSTIFQNIMLACCPFIHYFSINKI